MNIEEEEFQDEFSTFGINIENEEIVLRLKELCQQYKLDASQIATEWVAYSNSNKNCKLNQERLELLERDRLKKSAKINTPSSTGKKFTKNKIHNSIDAVSDSESFMDSYSTPKGKSINKRLQATPDSNAANKRLTGLNGSSSVPFSPTSFSPGQSSVTPSKKYSARTNAGEILASFGDEVKVWKSERAKPVNISSYDEGSALTSRYKFMFQKLVDKAAALNDITEVIGADIQKEHNLEEYVHVAIPAQEEVTVLGRICCDSQGKLNAKSVLLEGCSQVSMGRQVPVDLSELKQFALFPGQVVSMTGINSNGSKFVAKQIHECGAPAPPKERAELSSGPLNLLVAAGPYSTTDNLTFEPLADLIKVIKRESPDVCILMGPILDIKNPEVENGQLGETFDERFRNTVKQICDITANLQTRLVFVPSYRDVHHPMIYPQPPYNMPSDERVHFVSDPCLLNIDGLVVGLTSTDVLLQLGTEEISFPPGSSDRLSRLAGHLLTQRSFYPLYPPTEEMNIDYAHYEHYATLPVTPHVLITPSDLRYFIKDLHGSCCVNPGRLAKGHIGGSFAKLTVRPLVGDDVQPVVQRVSAQIVRI